MFNVRRTSMLFTVGIYSKKTAILIKPLRIADTINKAIYLCEHFKERIELDDDQVISYH